ncbi:MAG TPA: phosphatidylinositol-specific phospholipase C/glycerophosphodiester phosphodiesterase family protein [Lacipirellulaceae bacterium]|nr:phosphatidylinositol-specific phospholipase C/glycerophosphodiester phosphodiesterase family protein [Lacipirellulaceae bacterium]
MNSPRLSLLIITFLFAVSNCGRGDESPGVTPLLNAHAHNDYEHEHPLFDALEQGFASVEADVYPVNGELLVGHNRRDLKPERTLESLYLTPLAERVEKNGGHVFSQPSRFFLLIDIKADPTETYRLLKQLFSKHASMLTSIENDRVHESAITLVLTGDRPKLDPHDKSLRYVGLDGRVSDADSGVSADFMPMISDAWRSQFRWNGTGDMPPAERTRLMDIVKKAHAAGRVVRFWETPENENLWRELRADGVDLINTDQLARLAKFLKSSSR